MLPTGIERQHITPTRMKAFKFIAFFALLSVCGFNAQAQGTVIFSTFPFAPVTDQMTGQRIPSSAWLAQLYYGPAGASESQLISVANPPANLVTDGFVTSGTRFTDPAVVAGGSFGTFRVRLWSAILGPTWETAYPIWLSGFVSEGKLGKSNLGLIRTGDPDGSPPESAASLQGIRPGEIGIQPFTVGIPEPGIWALGLVSALTALWFRRQM